MFRRIAALADAGDTSLGERGWFAVLAALSVLLPWSVLGLVAVTAYHAAELWWTPLGGGLVDLALWAASLVPDPVAR